MTNFLPICIHVHKAPELHVSIRYEDMAFSCDDSFEFGLPPIPSTPEQMFSPSVNIVITNLLCSLPLPRWQANSLEFSGVQTSLQA